MIWRIYLQKARNANAKDNVDLALEYMEKMLKWHPNLNNKILFGYFLLKNGRIERAKEVFEQHIMCHPKVTKVPKPGKRIIINKDEMLARINYGLLLWKLGELDKAISETEFVLRRFKNTVVYTNLGFFYILKGDLEKALAFNLEACDFAPDNNVILDNLGCTYMFMNKLDEAEEVYKKLMAKDKAPAFPEAYYNYGMVKVKQGKKDEGLKLFKKALTYKFSNLSNVTKEDVEKAIKDI